MSVPSFADTYRSGILLPLYYAYKTTRNSMKKSEIKKEAVEKFFSSDDPDSEYYIPLSYINSSIGKKMDKYIRELYKEGSIERTGHGLYQLADMGRVWLEDFASDVHFHFSVSKDSADNTYYPISESEDFTEEFWEEFSEVHPEKLSAPDNSIGNLSDFLSQLDESANPEDYILPNCVYKQYILENKPGYSFIISTPGQPILTLATIDSLCNIYKENILDIMSRQTKELRDEI